MSVSRPAMGSGITPHEGRLFLREDHVDRGVDLVLAASRTLMRDVRDTLESQKLNATEFDVLMEIRRSGSIDVSTLRTRLGAAKPTLARVLGELANRELISRDKSHSDGRRRNLSLTDKGEDTLRDIAAQLRLTVGEAYRRAGEPHVTGAIGFLATLVNDEADT